ncbi:MAG: hypothetical protein WCG44_03030 [bacterium]
MSKTDHPATTKEIEEITKLLRRGRTRYENSLLEIEQIWNTLDPHDYARRAKLIKSATSMIEIDQTLKAWEQKLDSGN